MTDQNPETQAQQQSTANTGELTPAQFIEMINSLPDKIAEAMQQKLAIKSESKQDQQGNGQQEKSSTQENPGGKVFGYPSFAHWFAGDHGESQ
jgi:hypothetical protein